MREVKSKVKSMLIIFFNINGRFLTELLATKETGYCISPTHRLTLPFFSVSQIKIKLKGRHFDTIEVIDAES
jgi:hypothetical protein